MSDVKKVSKMVDDFFKEVEDLNKYIATVSTQMSGVGKVMMDNFGQPIADIISGSVNAASVLQTQMDKIGNALNANQEEVLEWALNYQNNLPILQADIQSVAAAMDGLLGPLTNNKVAVTDLANEWTSYAIGMAEPFLASVQNASNSIPLIQQSLGVISESFALNKENVLDWAMNYEEKMPLVQGEIMNIAGSLDAILAPLTKNEDAISNLTSQWMEYASTLTIGGVGIEDIMGTLASVIGPVTMAMEAFAVVQNVLAIASAALNISMLPLIAIILAVVVAIAAVIAIFLYWDEIVAFVKVGIGKFKDFAMTAFGAIKGFLSNIWDGFSASAKGAINGVVGVINGLLSGVKNAINSVINGLNSIIKNINKIPGVNIGLISSLGDDSFKIPMLADGGIVSRATLAVIGEAGPEAVVPLSKLDRTMGGGIKVVQIPLDGKILAEVMFDRMGNVIRQRTGLRV